ncbi:hypothetical protein EYF80_024280 [Liparis tanakae]|uniref:Uncharacterized protein n=1 Tax=Liparis tanakae TaxID=230148 RepID=A0A4Z2HIP8_9TELE|nr:hypothetical protein EYF80_024280 [Liparis tanakae]
MLHHCQMFGRIKCHPINSQAVWALRVSYCKCHVCLHWDWSLLQESKELSGSLSGWACDIIHRGQIGDSCHISPPPKLGRGFIREDGMGGWGAEARRDWERGTGTGRDGDGAGVTGAADGTRGSGVGSGDGSRGTGVSLPTTGPMDRGSAAGPGDLGSAAPTGPGDRGSAAATGPGGRQLKRVTGNPGRRQRRWILGIGGRQRQQVLGIGEVSPFIGPRAAPRLLSSPMVKCIVEADSIQHERGPEVLHVTQHVHTQHVTGNQVIFCPNKKTPNHIATACGARAAHREHTFLLTCQASASRQK